MLHNSKTINICTVYTIEKLFKISNTRVVSFYAVEVSARGQISKGNRSRLQSFLLKTCSASRDSLKSLVNAASKASLLSSYSIFAARREPTWENPAPMIVRWFVVSRFYSFFFNYYSFVSFMIIIGALVSDLYQALSAQRAFNQLDNLLSLASPFSFVFNLEYKSTTLRSVFWLTSTFFNIAAELKELGCRKWLLAVVI